MSRGNGLDHTEKCRKFREQIQNLKMDLADSRAEVKTLTEQNEKLREKIKEQNED